LTGTDAREIHFRRADPSGAIRDPDARLRTLNERQRLAARPPQLSIVVVRKPLAWIGKVDQLAYVQHAFAISDFELGVPDNFPKVRCHAIRIDNSLAAKETSTYA
jgi:hypothetical protein